MCLDEVDQTRGMACDTDIRSGVMFLTKEGTTPYAGPSWNMYFDDEGQTREMTCDTDILIAEANRKARRRPMDGRHHDTCYSLHGILDARRRPRVGRRSGRNRR